VPRPALPSHWYAEVPGEDRKAVKKRGWLPVGALEEVAVEDWLVYCRPSSEVPGSVPQSHPQPHNTINRLTGTTGEGAFAPYATDQHWYGTDSAVQLSIYVVVDETRLDPDELKQLFSDVGAFGFGRDASLGLGKFAVADMEPHRWPHDGDHNAWLTLAPSAPQGLGLNPQLSFYQVFTRFGRHGDIGVHFGNPFKTPVLLAQTGAVFSPRAKTAAHGDVRQFLGQGLGGSGSLSKTIEATVHQGYAPVVGIRLPAARRGHEAEGA